MNINDLFRIAEEFFSLINPNFTEDYDYENYESETWKLFEDFFDQMNPQI